MSARTRAVVVLSCLLGACGGNPGKDLFDPSTGAGRCSTANCSPNDASAGHDQGASQGGAGGATTQTTGAAGSNVAQGTGGAPPGPGAGGSPASGGSTGGTSAGASMGGSSGAAGSPDDAGVMEDVAVLDANANDGRVNPPDVGTHDSCVPTGSEVCDGIDNNCSGRIDENACRDGCVGATIEGVGYMFCYSTAQQRTWKEAETDCEAHKMHLARVDSAMQNSFIRKTALDVNFNDNIWLGGSDAAVEGRWVWIDDAQFWMGNFNGRPINGLFTAWDMGQPNSASGQEDCLAMWANTTMWHDSTCGTHEAYMCQGMPPLP